jgi:hypothetical protein
VAPSFIGFMLCFRVGEDVQNSYGNYPAWANGIFGWFLCVGVPVIVMLYSLTHPMDVDGLSESDFAGLLVADDEHENETPFRTSQ